MIKNVSIIEPVTILLISLILSIQLPAQDQNTQDYMEGKSAGESDASGNLWWIAAGFFPPWGNIWAYLNDPDIPPEALIGKSSEYIRGYVEGYKGETKISNLKYSVLGTCVFLPLGILAVGYMAEPTAGFCLERYGCTK